jgi:hypothetical protein
MNRIPFRAGVAALAIAAFILTAWAGQVGSPARTPIPPASDNATLPPLPEMLVIEGLGEKQAQRALGLVRTQLPFAVQLPGGLPAGYVATKVSARVLVDGRAVLDILYHGQGQQEYHLFEMNTPNTKEVLAPVVTTETITVAQTTWTYRLLSFYQPDGSRLLEHSVERAYATAQPYTSVSLRSSGDLPAEKTALIASIASLQ